MIMGQYKPEGWISVEDYPAQLPCVIYYGLAFKECRGPSVCLTPRDLTVNDTFTHWMPIPSFPVWKSPAEKAWEKADLFPGKQEDIKRAFIAGFNAGRTTPTPAERKALGL